jgi:ABC-type lipoprotein release transport system permease subunit
VNVSLFIARRYLFAKKSHNIINIISIISFAGVMIATAALFIVLSAFNGIAGYVGQLFNSFSPQIEITPRYGKIIPADSIDIEKIATLEGVEYYSEVLSDVAVFVYEDRQFIAKLKGVYPDYYKMNRLDTIVYSGEFLLEHGGFPFAVLGAGVASHLNCPPATMINNALKIYYPDRTKKRSAAVSMDALNSQAITPVGVFFTYTEYDGEFVFVPLDFARTLLSYESGMTSLEIRCKPSTKIANVQAEIKKIVGENYYVKNAYEQEEELFKVMQSEKWITYAILSFILLIASFNMIGMIAILILEKKQSVSILYSMGANINMVRKIFIYEGMLISMLGVVFGLVIGFIICILQIQFGFVSFGDGSYLLTAYPIEMQWVDVLLIPLVVFCITLPASFFLSKRIYPKLSSQ